MEKKSGRKKGSKNQFKLTERPATTALRPMRLTLRDVAIIQAVYEHRALTTAQVETLLFASDSDKPYGKKTRCQSRLQALFRHGYLFRDEQPTKAIEGRKPLVYFLDKKGALLLLEQLELEPEELDWRPKDNTLSQPFIEHLIKTNDIRVAIEISAVQMEGVELVQWLDDKTLKSKQMKDYVTIASSQGRTQKAAIVPDGYFHLEDSQYSFHHFLEADRATVVGQFSRWGRRDWARKVQAYLAYYRSGLYQKRYETESLRILTITTTSKRLANLKTITEAAGGKGRFWFTLYDQISPNTVLAEPIWQKAGSEGLFALMK